MECVPRLGRRGVLFIFVCMQHSGEKGLENGSWVIILKVEVLGVGFQIGCRTCPQGPTVVLPPPIVGTQGTCTSQVGEIQGDGGEGDKLNIIIQIIYGIYTDKT